MDDTALATEIDDLTTTLGERHDAELPDAELLVDELLVEEISIDGMCGVY